MGFYEHLKIARIEDAQFEENLNQHDVPFFDIRKNGQKVVQKES